MTLKEFQRAKDLTLTELAALLGRPVTTVHGWLNKDRSPDPDMLADIVRRTKGEVTAAELRPDLAMLFREPRPRSRRAAACLVAPAETKAG